MEKKIFPALSQTQEAKDDYANSSKATRAELANEKLISTRQESTFRFGIDFEKLGQLLSDIRMWITARPCHQWVCGGPDWKRRGKENLNLSWIWEKNWR